MAQDKLVLGCLPGSMALVLMDRMRGGGFKAMPFDRWTRALFLRGLSRFRMPRRRHVRTFDAESAKNIGRFWFADHDGSDSMPIMMGCTSHFGNIGWLQEYAIVIIIHWNLQFQLRIHLITLTAREGSELLTRIIENLWNARHDDTLKAARESHDNDSFALSPQVAVTES